MKKITLIMLTVVAFTLSTSAQSLKVERMVFAWENMKNMVVNSAKAMPEEHFGLIPAEGLRNFSDQIKHITTSNRFFITFLAEDPNALNDEIGAKNKNTLETISGKEAIVKDLEESFNYVISMLSKVKGFEENINLFGQTVSRMEALMLMEHHLQREQGKVTIYMRMKGIAPAKSTSWLL